MKNLTTLVAGNMSVQVIGLLFYPLLTRLYSPEEFSFFASFTSVVVIISVFIGGQYYQGISIAKSDEDAKDLVTLSKKIMHFNLSVLIFIQIILYLIFNYSIFYFLIPVSIYSYVLFEIGKYSTIREGNFKLLSLTLNINRLTSHLIKVLVPFIYFHKSILIFSEIVGYLLGLTFFRKKLRSEKLPKERLRSLASDYSFLPKFQMLNTSLQILYQEGPTLLFLLIFPKDLVGQYALAQKVFLQPLTLVGNSAANVLLNRYTSKLKNNEDITQITKKYLLYLSLGSIVFSLVVVFFPVKLLEPIFGQKWDDLILLIKILSVAVISRLLNGYIIVFNLSTSRSSFLLKMRILHIIFLLTYSYFMRHLEFKQFLMGFLMIDVVMDLLITIFLVFRLKKKTDKIKILFLANTNATWIMRDYKIIQDFSNTTFHLFKKMNPATWVPIIQIVRNDLVYAWFGSLNFFPTIFIAWLLGKKIIIVAGGYDVASVKELSYGSFSKNIGLRFLRYLLFSFSDFILPVSESNERETLNAIPLLKNKIRRINHGFEKYDGLLKDYHDRQNQIVTIAMVNDESYLRKGIDRFLQMAQMMPENKFILIGSVSTSIKQIIVSLNLSNLVVTGFLDQKEMDEILSNSKIYLQLSRHEAFGASVVEAIQRGCLPIVSNVYSLPWVVQGLGAIVETHENLKIKDKITEMFNFNFNSLEAHRLIEKTFSLSIREKNLRDIIL